MLTRCRSAWTLSLLLAALVAVAVLFVGGAPAEAQGQTTVTRTSSTGIPVQVREGKYYKVVAVVDGEQRAEAVGRVREGDLMEFIVAVGANVGVGFECTTHAGTAGAADYVGGTFPIASADFAGASDFRGTSTLPLVAKLDSDTPAENIWEPSEYFELECLPTGPGSGGWQADGSPRLRVEILDAVEATQGPTRTVTRRASTPELQMDVGRGKFYRVGIAPVDAGVALAEGSVSESNLAEMVVAVGSVPPVGGLGMECTVKPDSATDADYVKGIFQINQDRNAFGNRRVADTQGTTGSHWQVATEGANEGKGGMDTLPIVTKGDFLLEGDEWMWVECYPSSGTQKNEFKAWPSPRARLRIVDDTTAVRFAETEYTFEEGQSGAVLRAVASSDVETRAPHLLVGGIRGWHVTARPIGQDGTVMVKDRKLFLGAVATEDYTLPDRLDFNQSPDPVELGGTLVDDEVCEAPETFTVSLAEPTIPSERWIEINARYAALGGGPTTARVTIIDDGDPLPAPDQVNAELDGTQLRMNWTQTPSPCAHHGVEMQYKLSTSTTWTSGIKRGKNWDYDNDGDPSDNDGLQSSYIVHLSQTPAMGTVYNVRVRWHNENGAGAWGEADTNTASAEWTSLAVADSAGTSYALDGGDAGPGFVSDSVNPYAVHVPPGLRNVQLTLDWTVEPAAAATVAATAHAYTVGSGARVTSSSGVTLTKDTAATVPLSNIGAGTYVDLTWTATFTGGGTRTERARLVVLRNNDWESANNYLKGLAMSAGGSQPTGYWPGPSWFNLQYQVMNVAWTGTDWLAGGRFSQWPAYPAPWAGTPVGLPQFTGNTLALTPAFDDEIYEYTASVPYNVALVTILPISDDPKATVTVNGRSPSTAVSLSVGENVITVVVTAENGYQRTYTVTVTRAAPNSAPTVASATPDATITSESGTSQVSLSGVFTDADQDVLTITASSSDEGVATVSVASEQATVTARKRGMAIITVTAADGNGGSVENSFTVTVKAAPVVVSAIADVSELAAGDTHQVSLSGVFNDADGDNLTGAASSSDSAVATVSTAIDGTTGAVTAVTVIAIGEGTATITLTAQDSDGNSVSDAFDVTVPAAEQQVELPGPVTGLAVTATDEDSVTVVWNAPESGGQPDGYIVHLRPEGGNQGSGTTKRPGADRTTVNFSNLESGQTYQVWVRAENGAGKGERTHASITLPAVLPGPVAGLELTLDGNTVTVSWSAPETGGAPDGYIVHVSPEDGGRGWTKTPKAKKTSVTFENLKAGQTYKVWVRAQNEAGRGERVHASITLPQPEEDGGQSGQ